MTITRRWQTGWELNSISAEIVAVNTGGLSISSTGQKTGSYCLRDTYGTSALDVNITDTYQVRAGTHINQGLTMWGNVCTFLRFMTSGGTTLVSLTAQGTTLGLLVGGVSRGTWTSWTPYIYFHLGIDIKIDSSAGWVKISMDGTEVISYTGNTGSSAIGKYRIGPNDSADAHAWVSTYYDDMYLDDTTGEATFAEVPDRRFYLLRPNADGTYSNWNGSDGNKVNNYQLVDDLPPSLTDYVQATASGIKDSYNMTTVTIPDGSQIYSVIPIATAIKLDASEELKLSLGTRLSSDELMGSGLGLPTSLGLSISERQTSKPGGGSWTQTDIDSVEIVIESAGTFS